MKINNLQITLSRYAGHAFVLFTFLLCMGILSCDNSAKKNLKSTDKLGKVFFYDSSKTDIMDIIVEIEDDEYHRAKGLMFRESLPDNQGMLFVFDDETIRYFWMKNTRISLDIIFINASMKIVKIQKNTTPYSEQTYPSEKPAKYVVEVRAGFSERYGIKEGQTISWEPL